MSITSNGSMLQAPTQLIVWELISKFLMRKRACKIVTKFMTEDDDNVF